MGKGFSKFKRKLRLGAIVRAVVFGLSLGAVTFAVLWALAKLNAQEPDLTVAILYAAAAAVVGGIVMLLILLPTKKRIARRIDRHLSLGEKTQTMLAFRKDSAPMVILQREHTDRILLDTPKKRVKGVCTWLFVLIPLVAALTLTAAALVPAKEPPSPPPVVENNFTITPWQTQALKDLIEKVKTSDMEEEPKEATVKQLESLLIKLGSIKKEPAMKEAVISCIEGIHTAVSEHNTYDMLAQALFQSPSDAVQDLGGAVNSLKALLIGEWMNTVKTGLTEGSLTTAEISAGITRSLSRSNVEEENPAYVALLSLAVELADLTDMKEETVASVLAKGEEMLNAALFIQATNEEVEDDTIYTLLSIFGIKASEVPEHVFNHPDDPRGEDDYDDQDDLDHINSGGLGPGTMIFGSNDTVYDPNREAYVTYGEVLADYYARITELLVDGKLPPELEDALNDYFAILFDGSASKESN